MLYRLLPFVGFAAAGVAGSGYLVQSNIVFAKDSDDTSLVPVAERIPSRAQQLSKLRNNTREHPFDVLIIGGGATGTGCALDAASRGLKTALVERCDFASGTSSKSTKLVHGGVRYLEKAVFQLDYGQLKLVWEALKERMVLLQNAPHLAHPIPILTPCYKWWEVPYYWAGLKAYDLVAGTRNLVLSRYLTPAESERRMPTLAVDRPDGQTLKGSILYYDGQFNDARLNVALACTAAAVGATVVNYVDCTDLIKNPDGKVVGAKCTDELSGDAIDVYARVVINATGPFADGVRRMSDATAPKVIQASSGAHVTLPSVYASDSVGLIIPKTKDGRVVFVLPWLDHVIAGTTDQPTEVTSHPKPTEAEINFILEAISDYLKVSVRRTDVLSAWSGIRPLALDPKEADTSNVLRDHVVLQEGDGMLTVTGGKWTTYRLMAQDAIDAAVGTGRLPVNVGQAQTRGIKLVGAHGYNPLLYVQVAQAYATAHGGRPMNALTARHLASAYGDRAYEVLRLAQQRGLEAVLSPDHPYLEAEVPYCVQHEYATTVEDFIARRTRLAFLDTRAAEEALPRVAELMGAELGWSDKKQKQEIQAAHEYLETMCIPHNVPTASSS